SGSLASAQIGSTRPSSRAKRSAPAIAGRIPRREIRYHRKRESAAALEAHRTRQRKTPNWPELLNDQKLLHGAIAESPEFLTSGHGSLPASKVTTTKPFLSRRITCTIQLDRNKNRSHRMDSTSLFKTHTKENTI